MEKNYYNSGDIRATLENWQIENPTDPSLTYNDVVDPRTGVVPQTLDQVLYLDKKVYDNDILTIMCSRATRRCTH